MKKTSVILAALGMSIFTSAQNSQPGYEAKFLNVGPLKTNYVYLHKVQNNLTPNHVRYLENVVSYWDVTGLEKFDKQNEQPFEVTFKSSHGAITASYDNEGKILSAVERFRDIALPNNLSILIAREYPKWEISKSRYSIIYTRAHEPQKRFRVQIRKGKLKQWLTIDTSGKSFII